MPDCLWPWNLPGSSVHGILQARVLEWVVMPSSRECPPPRDQIHVSWGSCNAGRFFASESPGKPINLVLSRPPFSIFKVSNSEQNHSHAQNSSYRICHLSVSLELAWKRSSLLKTYMIRLDPHGWSMIRSPFKACNLNHICKKSLFIMQLCIFTGS